MSFCRLAGLSGGQSTSVIIAASYPRAASSLNPTCRELNCPRSGAGFCTIDALCAAASGARSRSVFAGDNDYRFREGLQLLSIEAVSRV